MIIYLLHFHNANGTHFIKIAKRKEYKVPNNSFNCNIQKPYIHTDGRKWNIALDYSKYNVNEYKSLLEKHGGDIIASEFFFNYEHFLYHKRNNICNITILREPYERFMSSYTKHNKGESQSEFMRIDLEREEGVKVNYNKPNYYVRLLNNMKNDEEVKNIHCENACKILEEFDFVCILEDKNSFDNLDAYLKSKNIQQLEYSKVYDYNKKYEFNSEFYELNEYDYKLYNYAVSMNKFKLD